MLLLVSKLHSVGSESATGPVGSEVQRRLIGAKRARRRVNLRRFRLVPVLSALGVGL